MFLTIHLATDELYKDINKNIDRFMELLIGKTNYNINNICFNCFYSNKTSFYRSY